MNELIGNSANVMLAETESGRLLATVEVVLLVSEPKYQADPGGFVKTRSLSNIRFSTGVKGLRALIEEFEKLAGEAEEFESRVSLKPRDNDAPSAEDQGREASHGATS